MAAKNPRRPERTALEKLRDPITTLANSGKLLITVFTVLILFGAVSHMVLEDSTFGDGLWWAIVTASTVGYGDISPATASGRIVAGILIGSMVFLVVPLVVTYLVTKLVEDRNEFTHEEQEELKRNQRELIEEVKLLRAALAVERDDRTRHRQEDHHAEPHEASL